MAQRSKFAWVLPACFLLLSQPAAARDIVVAQLDCSAGRHLYNEAHRATASNQHEYALQLLHAVRSSVPRNCRLESDEELDRYEINLRNLIAQQGAGRMPSPCRPIQTGPTSYSCQ